jgi:hypothetical protein
MSARRARACTRLAGAQGAPLALIHRTNSPNPALARVSGRFESENGLPVAEVFAALRMPAALAFLMVRRLSDAAKSAT